MKTKYACFVMTVAVLAFMLSMTAGAIAQDVTHPSTTKSGAPTHTIHSTHIQNAEVIHVSGHDVVVRLENGRLELLNVPKDFKFDVDGKQLTAHQLTEGTKLTQEIHTVNTPEEVTTIRTVNGKVWHIKPPMVILEFPDGEHKQYKVPPGIVFKIEGEDKTVFDVRKGMEISATVVTVAPHNVVSTHTVVAGQAPTPAKVPFEGALLIEPAAPPAPVVTAAAEEPAPAELPQTASYLPLIGVLGLFFLAIFATLKIVRRSTT
jgi:hypothetical protein